MRWSGYPRRLSYIWRVPHGDGLALAVLCCRWIEHDPIELLQTVEECIEGAIKKAKDEGIQVKVLAVGLTNQRETTLVWDRVTGKPFYNAIVWFDNRTAPICHAFTQKLDSAVSPGLTTEELLNLFLITSIAGTHGHLGYLALIDSNKRSLGIATPVFTGEISTIGCLQCGEDSLEFW